MRYINWYNTIQYIVDCRLNWDLHVTNKIAAAKRAFSVRSSLKSTWGYDKRGLKFLFNSAVEPILLYGCSVWAPFLATKKGVKQLRSFQRIITLPLISAFKTVSSEGCLIISNILPIDLRVRKITYLRYCRASTGNFSAASLNWLTRLLPCSAPPSEVRLKQAAFLPLLASTWTHALQPSFLRDGCTLLPLDCSVQRIFVASTSSSSAHHCCLVTASHSQILDFTSGPLQADTAFFAMLLFVLHAITRACHVVREGGSAEIVAFHPSAFEFVRYNSKLSEVARLCLDRLAPYRDKILLCICQPSKAEGLQLAIVGCSLPGDSLEVLPPLLSSKSSCKSTIKNLTQGLWQSEWRVSPNGHFVREFFSTVKSASAIPLHQLCAKVTQILTGHLLLYAHQHRFNFVASPCCQCGRLSESVENFLSFCPSFSNQRLLFSSSCRSTDGLWPRPLSSIPSNPVVWNAFICLIRSTKRLRWNDGLWIFLIILVRHVLLLSGSLSPLLALRPLNFSGGLEPNVQIPFYVGFPPLLSLAGQGRASRF